MSAKDIKGQKFNRELGINVTAFCQRMKEIDGVKKPEVGDVWLLL